MAKQISVTEAHDLQNKGAVYVDVRSQMEFEAATPPTPSTCR
jgi:rhodanese-related sulfurtransferase